MNLRTVLYLDTDKATSVCDFGCTNSGRPRVNDVGQSRPQQQLRVAIVRPLAIPIDRSCYNSQELGLGIALARLGCNMDVFVVGARDTVQTTDIESSGPGLVRLHEVPFRKIPNIQQAIMPAMRRMLRSGRYDFIQVNESNELESWLVAREATKRGIAVSLYQGMYLPIAGRGQVAFQALYDRLLLPGLRRSVTAPLAKTKRAADFLMSRGFRDVRVLPVGLDPTAFYNPVVTEWRAKLGIPAEHMLLTYVGILESRRRPDLILDIAAALQNESVSFLVAGSGPEEGSIQSAIDKRDLKHVYLLGKVPQRSLPSLYEQSSLLLLPSTYEIYGMVVLEAMYFGLPVVSNRTAGPESLIDSGTDGILIDDLEVDTWIKAIRQVLASRDKRNSLALAAREKVARHLTWDRIAQTYLEDVIRPAVVSRTR